MHSLAGTYVLPSHNSRHRSFSIFITKAINMRVSSSVALCAVLSSAAGFHIPFLSPSSQKPIQIEGDTKPLVDSSALQELVSGDRLMWRAKELYEIAKLGEGEYNHPTRVIGSLGQRTCSSTYADRANPIQATSERFPTSTKIFSSSATIIPLQISRFPLFLVMYSKAALC